jgi:manganese/zinc/iron transport system ATP- binding protein
MNRNAASGESSVAVSLAGVTVAYGNRIALENISLQIPAGSLTAVIGPNGAGKTTLFNALLGLIRPMRGQIRLFDRSPAAARHHVAYVPQRETVDWSFPIVVEEVVMMGRVSRISLGCRPHTADHAAVERSLVRVGMAQQARTPIADLSGGQQQRVFIARALAREAPLLLLDEPFNQIDQTTQELLLALLNDIVRKGGTVLVATHDLPMVRQHFPRVMMLNRQLIAAGTPAEVFRPELMQLAYEQEVVWRRTCDGQECLQNSTAPVQP